jgi:HPt (histidine-containing phosphotransfer) domain-containing protein
MPEGPSGISDRLARLGHAFFVRSRDEASRLSELQRALGSSDPGLVAAAVGEIGVVAHRLHGTAGTLGFAAISEAAAAVEDAISVLGGQGVPVEPNAARALAATIERLVGVIDGLEG